MTTATNAIERVAADAVAKAKPDPVSYRTMAVGDYHRQGDVYIQRIAGMPSGCEVVATVAQLAPGNTQGSRHCIKSEHINHVVTHRLRNASPLQGPILKTSKRVEIEHPEHGCVTVPAGIYSITYQRQFAEELKRVAD